MHNPFLHHQPLRCYPSAQDLAQVSLLEIGPGRGDFLFELARRFPEQKVAAVEIKRKRYEKLIRRIQRNGLKNIVLIHGDARVALPCLFTKEQIKTTYILFSDPWPKLRHAKHRLFQAYFVHELYRALQAQGEVVLAHDDPRYLTQSRELLAAHPAFTELCLDDSEELFKTFYAEKWRQEGRTLASCCFQKSALPKWKEAWLHWQTGLWRLTRSKQKIDLIIS